MLLRMIVGLLIVAVAAPIAIRRLLWVARLVRSGQPVSGRFDNLPQHLRTEFAEVLGQRKLLKWSVPGLAHFFTMWGFTILLLTIIELFGALFVEDFAIPIIGRWAVIGFIEDFFAVAVLIALGVFALIRVRRAPSKLQRQSRFYGSHTGAAWVILGMITAVIVTLLIGRAAQVNTGNFPFGKTWWTFASTGIAKVLEPLGKDANFALETAFIWIQIAVIMGFLVLVAYSKHLHIGAAPINVLAKREPKALGALLPMESGGKPINFEDPGEDDVFGRGKIEDFTWKGMLDFATCTECGRCQSQCPAWNTDKPLSPKLVIMDLRDHLFAKAPYILAGGANGAAGSTNDSLEKVEDAAHGGHHGVPESGFGRIPHPGKAQNERPLVGTAADGGVIDPDVLWSCTTCGACVEQCPVDIEHVDHIVDMRRYQVLMESAFPAELGGLFKNLEKTSNPWGVPARTRLDWAKGLPFEVPVVGADVEDLTEKDYLFWVGCAGAIEDRSKRTTRAVAELLHRAGVSYAVLGEGESCTGDPARRAGNEFLFQMLAQANVEMLNEVKATKIVVTCAHCFNALKNEYPQVGGQYEVIHHTQLLNRLVREGRLTPVAPIGANGGPSTVTYHDPCYIGRHNGIYTPPRELIASLPGVTYEEMPRNQSRSFCCGAGGARMWMEETLGTRINNNRVDEAVATGADTIAVSCPFCMVMLTDGLTTRKSDGSAREEVEVLDVAQMLLAAVTRGDDKPEPAEAVSA